jgi:uncharacterized tellurite resistance protein B-like protein
MIDRLTQFFTSQFLEEESKDQDHGIEFATAALLIEISRSDQDRSDSEKETILAILTSQFEFTAEELSNLIDLAEEAIEDAHDLHQFTHVVNEHYDYAARKRMVELLWQVAYADGRIDKFEEHIIRRIAGLVHVDNKDFIHAKVTARERAAT